MAASEESMRLFRIRKNVMEMLKDRGYLVLDAELSMDYKQFKDKFGDSIRRDDLTVNKAMEHNPSDQIFVIFPNDEKVGAKHIKEYLERMRQERVFRAILVVQQKLTPFANRAIHDQEVTRRYNVEVFLEAELLVNINKHMLVPEHQVLSDAEKKALLERYHLKDTQVFFAGLVFPSVLVEHEKNFSALNLLPRIQLTDPVAKYHGLRRGQVVKIIRPSETAGRYITYRFVV